MFTGDVVRSAGRTAIDLANAYFFDLSHKKEAMRIVDVIRKHNGRELTRTLRKAADDYAAEVFGSKKYAPWLYVYSLVRGGFREGWIPDNFFGRRVVPRINRELQVVAEFKTFSNIALRCTALPDIGYFIDGVFYDRDFSIISFETFRTEILDRHDAVFVKKDGSVQGRGVAKLKKKDFAEKFFSEFGNSVIQLPIRQHGFFDRIVSGSVATLRITTVKEEDGTIGKRAAYLRLGRKNTAWLQSTNSVRVAVVNDEGDLDEFGYTQDWRRWAGHPDTGFLFADNRIPNFSRAVADCVALHRKVPHLTLIGWDTAIGDDDKTKIIEWNAGHSDIKFSEATTGPCFLGLGWERFREC